MRRAATAIRGPKGGIWDVFIGLEVHAQIRLNSKLFSRSRAGTHSEYDHPNSRVSLFDASYPGTLPVLNKHAVEQAIRTALALGCKVNRRSIFERKHYFYSDLPHGFQITQHRRPIAIGGSLPLLYEATATADASDSNETTSSGRDNAFNGDAEDLPSIKVARIQLEVDSGKSLHDTEDGVNSFVDLNRAGTALMEIVLEPEIRGAAEAGAAVKSLQLLLRRMGTCDGNMEDGSMRCDLNISVRRAGEDEESILGQKVEVKNMNSVRHLVMAANQEARRQVQLLELGQGPVAQETRGFDEAKGETVRLRGKEGAVDYRFFPEPDLPPLVLSDAHMETIESTLPELPQMTIARLSCEYGIAGDVSRWLVCAPWGASDYFERLVAGEKPGDGIRDPRVAANWVCNNLFRRAKDRLSKKGDEEESSSDADLEGFFPAERLGGLLDLLADGTISSQTAKSLLRTMTEENLEDSAASIVEARGLQQMTDRAEIKALCRAIVEDPNHEAQLAKFRAGKTNLSKFFMGQAFKATQGRADGKVVEECVMDLLHGHSPVPGGQR